MSYRAPTDRPTDSGYVQLVARLCETRPVVAVNATVGTALVGIAAAWRSNDIWLAALTIATCLLTLAAAPLLIKGRASPPTNMEQAQAFERRYAFLVIVPSFGVGAMCAWALMTTADALIHLLLIGLVLARAGPVLRNHVRPWIVRWQLAGFMGPPAAAALLQDDPLYLVVAFGGLLLAYNMVSITAVLHEAAGASLVRDEEARRQNLCFDAALNNMAQGLCMFDSDSRLLVCNERYLQMFGFSPEIVKPGASLLTVLEHSCALGNYPDRTPEQVHSAMLDQLTLQRPASFHLTLADGRTFAVAHEPMPGGGWVATHEDITERKAVEARIAYLARHDPLTGLSNRVVFRERLDQALARARRGEQIALLCIDLDRFKAVNDTLGHSVGDSLMTEVAARLRSCVRESDVVARYGGDEFVIVQSGGEQPRSASLLAERAIAALSAPYEIDEHRISIGASIGVSIAPQDTCDAVQLLRNADLALYRAKADGRGQHHFFAPEMDDFMQKRRSLELDLRPALANGEFEIVYQPLITLESGRITGFEALLRWNHPTRGLVMPGEFIALAEETGIISSIGDWVLRDACATAAGWPEDLHVAVNLSAAQFRTGALADTVRAVLAETGLAAERLELEITESVLLADSEATLLTLHTLRDLDVRIAMDDFGTGYSSLSYLRAFPFDKIKIDRSFVSDVSTNAEAMAIVRTITELGRSLGMVTTAEGIETSQQLDQLRAVGCDEAQGYLLGRPMSAADAAAFARKAAREKASSQSR